MNKELYVSSTPHETKVALLEDDQLAEIYYERANEYTLAGSIYKGRVTRVLPGMQSAFVDIGLERDAFLYVSDFLDLQEEDEDDDFSDVKVTGPSVAKANGFIVEKQGSADVEEDDDIEDEVGEAEGAAEQHAGEPAKGTEDDEGGSRRWRGRRRRRGRRGGRDRYTPQAGEPTNGDAPEQEAAPENGGQQFVEEVDLGEEEVEHSAQPSSTGAEVELEGMHGYDDGGHEAYPASTEEPMLLPGETRAPRTPRAPGEAAPEESREHRSEGFRGGRDRGDRGGRFGRDRGGRDRGGRDRGGRGDRDRGDREPRSREPEAPLPSNYTPIVLPGESLSKYRDVPAARIPEEEPTPSFDAGTVETAEAPGTHYVEPVVHHEEEHEPTEASAELRERPAIAPFRADIKNTEVADEQQRFHDMNVASVFGGAEVEEEVEQPAQTWAKAAKTQLDKPAVEEHTHDTYIHDNHAVETQAGDASWSDVPASAPTEANEPEEIEEARTHQEGNYSPEGDGSVVHEEMDEEETDMLSASDHYRMHDLDNDAADRQHDFATRLGDAAGLLGDAVRDTEEERAIEGDEYEFNGSDEFEESEMLADGDTEVEAEEEEEGAEEEAEPVEGTTTETPRSPRRGRPDRPMRGRRERGGRSDRGERGGDRGRMGRGGRPRREPRVIPLISDVLKEGQEILVQIAKEPIGKKGARITSHIALPGRFLVYMPTVNHIGVSRKISSDEERQRLKRIVASERENGHGGFIVRTAAANIKEEDLRADIRFLKHLWHEIRERSEKSKSPALIYHDLNLVERILRDQVTQDFSQIWVDTESEYERVVRFASRFQPNLVRRIKLYTKDTPLYEQFGIQEEINKSLKSKVWLKSGGYIVINQTEALVAIDINTGKYVGKTQRLEDTIVKTNVDAIKEIVRQVRLRDLGGIIVIDFIDMDERRNRQKVMAALEEALKADRAPSKVLQFNDFGLVAITRKRVKQSLERTLGTPCPYCEATGFVKSVTTMCNEIYTELRKVRNHIDSNEVTLRVHPEVAKELKSDKGKWIMEMEEMIGHPILLKSDASVHQEQFDLNF
jgi:Rne/Rng family ribonuclease